MTSLTKVTVLDKDTDWRKGKTPPECHLHVLTNQIACDVQFCVGEAREIILAHKIFLISHSCVFESMFCGRLEKTGEVEIPEIEPRIFQQFLRFVYTNDVMIMADNAVGLLHTSRKYAVLSLEERCLQFLETSITLENVCVLLEQAHLYEKQDLSNKALEFIKQNAENVLNSSSFSQLCHSCFDKVTSADDLLVDELIIFHAAVKWTEAECKRQEKEATPETKREILGFARYNIRYPLIHPRHFVEEVGPSGVLTDIEKITILEHYLCPERDTSPFLFQIRQDRQRRAMRFTKYDGEWSYDWKFDDAVAISCDKTIHLHGCILYGPKEKPTASYDIKTYVYNESDIILPKSQVSRNVEASRDDVSYDILFQEPLRLEKHKKYFLIVNIKGPPTFKGINGQSKVTNDGVTFYFAETKWSKNHTTRKSGQIPGLIYNLV